ncbi:MAG: DUF4956 domain-containing protein [Chloroherpetonaceae bacterium]|nr:DUF4956 domain-containing protein [Chthonomonadaceae bacterium]MDW8207779.1 DUF4956 domain-containing protein [Chloroherpetonaceae bacterium]
MPEAFFKGLIDGPQVPAGMLLLRLLLAGALGGVVTGIYVWTHRRDGTLVPGFLSTLVLLSILIAMVTQVIGDNVARAFSLVGALSIVRFRTVVEDTRDTAFVICAVVVGMAVGAGHPEVALMGLPVVGVAAAALRPRALHTDAGHAAYWNVSIRTGLGASQDEQLADLLAQHCLEYRLQAVLTSRQGAARELLYRVRLRPQVRPMDLFDALNLQEGVQYVELREG